MLRTLQSVLFLLLMNFFPLTSVYTLYPYAYTKLVPESLVCTLYIDDEAMIELSEMEISYPSVGAATGACP